MNFFKQKFINHLVCFSRYLIKYFEKLADGQEVLVHFLDGIQNNQRCTNFATINQNVSIIANYCFVRSGALGKTITVIIDLKNAN